MDTLLNRVSVRRFLETPVPDELIQQIIKAAAQAPSAGNQQPWEFYVVKNKSIIEELSNASPYAKCAANAPFAIIVCERTQDLRFPEYAQIDCSIATEHLWLAATALGLGGVWLGIAPINERVKRVNEILDLPDSLDAFSLFVCGYPADVKEPVDRFDPQRIHIID